MFCSSCIKVAWVLPDLNCINAGNGSNSSMFSSLHTPQITIHPSIHPHYLLFQAHFSSHIPTTSPLPNMRSHLPQRSNPANAALSPSNNPSNRPVTTVKSPLTTSPSTERRRLSAAVRGAAMASAAPKRTYQSQIPNPETLPSSFSRENGKRSAKLKGHRRGKTYSDPTRQ